MLHYGPPSIILKYPLSPHLEVILTADSPDLRSRFVFGSIDSFLYRMGQQWLEQSPKDSESERNLQYGIFKFWGRFALPSKKTTRLVLHSYMEKNLTVLQEGSMICRPQTVGYWPG